MWKFWPFQRLHMNQMKYQIFNCKKQQTYAHSNGKRIFIHSSDFYFSLYPKSSILCNVDKGNVKTVSSWNPILIVKFHIFATIFYPLFREKNKPKFREIYTDERTDSVAVVHIHNNVHTQRQPHWQAISKRVRIVSICRLSTNEQRREKKKCGQIWANTNILYI